MVLCDYLRTIDLARAGGSVFSRCATMKPWACCHRLHGARAATHLYTRRHLAALKTARSLVGGYGWQRMPTIMQALHRGDLGVALTTIDTCHSEQALKRRECEQTLSALHALAKQPTPEQSSRYSQEAWINAIARS